MKNQCVATNLNVHIASCDDNDRGQCGDDVC